MSCSKHSPVTSDSSRKHSHISSGSSRKNYHITSESSSKHSSLTSESSWKHSDLTSQSSGKDSEITSESSRKHRHITSESTSKLSNLTSESSRKDSEITLESSRKRSGITSESCRQHHRNMPVSSKEQCPSSSKHCPSRRHRSRSLRKGACRHFRRHLRNSPLSSRQLVGWLSSCPKSIVTRSGDMASVQQSPTSVHSKRSSEAISADQSSKLKSLSSSSSCAKTSAATGSNVECAVQDYSPLIVDATGVSTSKGTNTRKTCSVLDTIMDKTSECVETDHELDDFILKVPGKKRRHADSSAPQTVKAKGSDTLATCVHKQNCSQHEDDTSSVITLGSDDDEVEIIDSDPKPQLGRSSKTDVDPKPHLGHSSITDVVIDTLHTRKPETVIIDLCSPSVNSKYPELTQKYTDREDEKTSSKHTCSEQAFKEYVSVLGDGFRTSSDRPKHVPSVSNHTAYRGLVPSASSAFDLAVNSGVEKIQDCEVVFVSGGEGGDKTNSASVFGSSVQKRYHSDRRKRLQAIDNRMDQTSAPSSSACGNNLYNPNPNIVRTGLRPIVIDGSNVAMGHSNGRIFSCRGLQICIEFFLQRNHSVVAFVPQFRKSRFHSQDTQILTTLEKQGLVIFTPSRKIGNQLVVPYDDRFIVQYAAECGGVIVSTDNYRDLLEENPAWRETIETRLLMFTWVGDVLMFPQDPLGRQGPNLESFLRFPSDGCSEAR